MDPRRPIESSIDLPGCIAGRADAWATFVRETAGTLHAAVRKALERRGANRSDLDDCVQEIYIRLLREECRLLRTFEPQRAALTTWLTIIARTIVHERSRKPTLPMGGGSPEDRAITPPRVDPPEPLPWHALSQQQQQVLQALFHEGLSVEEVAARLEIDTQTVRSAKHKALARLRDELRPAPPAEAPTNRHLRGDERPPPRLSPSESLLRGDPNGPPTDAS